MFACSQGFFVLNILLLFIFQEDACRQPVAIFTALQVIVMVPSHMTWDVRVIYTSKQTVQSKTDSNEN